MRVVFMGSPEFALPTLRRLIESEHDVVGVYTQPDRPVGRGRRLAPPPVKQLAAAHGVPVFQPKSISKPESVEQLRTLAPDVGVIAAYGQILKQPVLDVPPLGVLNVHASLLPRWRGAAPIPAAILAGDTRTGATIMKVVLALDAGPILGQTEVEIAPDDTTATLTPRVAEAGAALLLELLPKWARGAIATEEQDESLVTYAPQLRKSDGLIDWARHDADTIVRMVRAYDPWPTAYTYVSGQQLSILRARVLETRSEAAAGTVVGPAPSDDGFVVATVGNDLAVVTVKPAGRKPMPAGAFARGKRDLFTSRLG